MDNYPKILSEVDRSYFVPLERLMAYEEFASFSHERKFQIIDFVQFMYHKQSPFVRDYESLQERAAICLKHADVSIDTPYGVHLSSCGMETTTEKYEEHAMTLSAIDDMIACYLAKIQRNADWEALVTLQMLAWEYAKKLRTPATMLMEPDKELKAMEMKTKITDPYLELPEKIKSLSEKVFGKNEKAAKAAEEKLVRPSAENMAAKYTKKG